MTVRTGRCRQESCRRGTSTAGLLARLHVTVLDAIVHHLHEVAGAALADVCNAGAVVHLSKKGGRMDCQELASTASARPRHFCPALGVMSQRDGILGRDARKASHRRTRLSSHLLHNGLDPLPGLLVASRHHGRAYTGSIASRRQQASIDVSVEMTAEPARTLVREGHGAEGLGDAGSPSLS